MSCSTTLSGDYFLAERRERYLALQTGTAPIMAITVIALIALTTDTHSVVVGAAIANLGAGMILPTLITWAISTLPAQQRGSGTGLWMGASFMGQYLSPLGVLGLSRLTGSLSDAIFTYAVACALSALSALLCLRGSVQQRGDGTSHTERALICVRALTLSR